MNGYVLNVSQVEMERLEKYVVAAAIEASLGLRAGYTVGDYVRSEFGVPPALKRGDRLVVRVCASVRSNLMNQQECSGLPRWEVLP